VPLIFLMAFLQAVVPPVRSLDKGSASQISIPREVIVRDRAEWAALWSAHAPGRPQPEVDFSSEMVVGVFVGTRPTAGFAVEIVGYRAVGSDVVVQYAEAIPPRGAITAQVLTSPFHLVVVPKQTGNVTFEKVRS
jgi:PrcB C-terminal